MESFEIKDYMNQNPVTVLPDTNIADVVKLTLKHKLSGVLVVDSSKALLGMISELDCLREMSESIYLDGRNTTSLAAKDIMTKEVTIVSPDAQLFDVMKSMLNQGQRRRPVVEDGKLIGQVTCRQLLKIITSF
ncbi:MAG: CBS domain-containing protein [Desulfuromonadales bacterium]|nr:CBS domain-containing protein [Desulfuromonadales bacterium]